MNPIVLHTQRKKRLNPDGYTWHILSGYHSSYVGRICNMHLTNDFDSIDAVDNPLNYIFCGYNNGSKYIIGGRQVTGDNFLMISEDGAYWESVPIPDFEWVFSIGWNGSYWLIAGKASDDSYIISWSADGITWATPTAIPGYPRNINNNNTHWFIGISNVGIAKIPFTVADWGNITYLSPGISNVSTTVCSASHMLVGDSNIVSGEPTIRYSTDFINWNTAIYPSQFAAVDTFCRHGSLWFATVHTGNPLNFALLKSTDGINFTEVTVDSQNTMTYMKIYSNGTKLVLTARQDDGHVIYTSDDSGAIWIRHFIDYYPSDVYVGYCVPKIDPGGIPPIT